MIHTVITGTRYPADLPDEFYFSSPEQYGGTAHVSDGIVIKSETGNILAIGQIIEEGEPYEECRTVKVIQRFL
jgi:hypothetical protein